MKKFLAVYIGTASGREKSGWDQMDEAKRKDMEASGIRAWGEWMAAHEAAIVEPGEVRSGRRSARRHRAFRILRTT